MTTRRRPKSPPPEAATAKPRRGLSLLLTLALVAATCIAFAPGLSGEFLNWDDDRNFVENEDYRGLGLEQLAWAWQTYHLGVWQPLSWMLLGLQYNVGEAAAPGSSAAGGMPTASSAADAAASPDDSAAMLSGGMDARIYHGTSLALHVLNALVFYGLTLALLRRAMPEAVQRSPNSARLCSAAAAALFALHPLRVEAVAWISCQPYVPAALFYMLGVWAYLGAHDAAAKARLAWLAVVFACYLAAVASKPAAVSLPVVLLILDVYPLRRVRREGWAASGVVALLEKLPFLIVAAAVSVWAAEAKDFVDTRATLSEFNVSARLAHSAYGLAFYLGRMVLPLSLSAYYRLPEDLNLGTWRFALAAVGVVVLTVGLIVRCRRVPAVLAAWVAYGFILLPSLGIVQISQQIAADRYGYIAIMPVMVLAAGWLLRMAQLGQQRRKAARLGLALMVGSVVVLLAGATREQTRVWHDSVALWSSVLETDSQCAVAECNLGAAYLQLGQASEASRHISRAIDLDKDFAWAYSNLGAILLLAGRNADAAACFEEALTVEPPLKDRDRAKAHAGLGEAYLNLGRYDLAWQQTRKAERLGFKLAAKMIE